MKKVIAVAVLVLSTSGCRIWNITENYNQPFDAQPGDRIDVIMNKGGNPTARCFKMGGWYKVKSNKCIDVDF